MGFEFLQLYELVSPQRVVERNKLPFLQVQELGVGQVVEVQFVEPQQFFVVVNPFSLVELLGGLQLDLLVLKIVEYVNESLIRQALKKVNFKLIRVSQVTFWQLYLKRKKTVGVKRSPKIVNQTGALKKDYSLGPFKSSPNDVRSIPLLMREIS